MGRILWPHLVAVLTFLPAGLAQADLAAPRFRLPVHKSAEPAKKPTPPVVAPAPRPLAPDAASVLGCALPIVPPGQEAQVVRLFAPPAGLVGVSADAIAIAGGRIAGTWLVARPGAQPERRVYLLSPRAAQADDKALLTKKFRIQLAAPCWGHGPIEAPDEPALRAFALAASATATCAAQPDLDRALQQAVLAAEDAVALACPATAAQAGDVSALLRELDAKGQVGDRDAAQKLLEQIEKIDTGRLDLTIRFDLGLALALHGRRALALQILLPALTDWQRQTPPSDRALAVREAERAAAATVWAETPPRGRQILVDCWSRFPEAPDGSGSCQAMALADALLAANRGDLAAGVLDEQLKRTPRPPAAWFAARIGLASRQDDSRAELTVATAAVQAWPEDLSLRDALATACFRAGEHLRAVRELEGIFKKNPDYQGVLGRLSGVVNDWGRVDPPREGQTSGWQLLRDEMRDRAAKDSGDTVAQFLYGVSLFYDAKFEQALVQMKLVEPRVKNEGRIFIYQAMAQLWLGHPEEAQKLADKAVLANPRDPDVYYCQSQVLRQHDKLAAAAMLQRYLDLEGQPGALHFAKKTKRVESEMALLKKGEMPPLWDKPGHYDDEDEPDRPAGLPTAATTATSRGNGSLNPPWQTWLWVGALALLVIGGGTWMTRKQK